MSRESWLDSESARWQADGLISEDTRQAILARYPKQSADPPNALMPLAVLTAGVGVILLVAWNWQALPWWLKLGLTKILMLSLYGGAAWSVGRQRARATELWLLGAVLASFAFFGAIVDVSHWDAPREILALSALTAAVTAALTGATLVTVLAAATLGWWIVVAGGGAIPWEFLGIFPLVALAAEQSRQRVAVVLTAIVFGAWPMFMALNTWETGSLSMMMILVAGAAIEQWSHHPAARRPAFAHATTGAAIGVIGLVGALIMAMHVPTSRAPLSLFHTHAGQSPWPALTLAVAMALIGFGPFRGAALRPRIVAVTALVWFNAALALRLELFGEWLWIMAFSGVLLFMGAGMVREAAVSRDRGVMGVGLAAIIALVLVHFSSGQALRGSLVLLISAAVLYLAGRKPSSTEVAS